MEWYGNLSAKWQRILIAVVFVVLLVGVQLLRQMVRTEELEPEKEKGTATRHMVRSYLEQRESQEG
jgi:hypothetical protein